MTRQEKIIENIVQHFRYLEYTFRWVTPNIKYIDFEKINLKGVFLRLKN